MRYMVLCCEGDDPEYSYYVVELTPAQSAAYVRAVHSGTSFRLVPELQEVYRTAGAAIMERETQLAIDCNDRFVARCMGRHEVSPIAINELVAKRDEYTMQFFGLDKLTESELDTWDARYKELPFVCDFQNGFIPKSPFECGWELVLEFCDTPS